MTEYTLRIEKVNNRYIATLLHDNQTIAAQIGVSRSHAVEKVWQIFDRILVAEDRKDETK